MPTSAAVKTGIAIAVLIVVLSSRMEYQSMGDGPGVEAASLRETGWCWI
jgi:hypothetical protein